MARSRIHTYYSDGSWINKIDGVGMVGSFHALRLDAVNAGRVLAQDRQGEHVVHKIDGTIATSYSYADGPNLIQSPNPGLRD